MLEEADFWINDSLGREHFTASRGGLPPLALTKKSKGEKSPLSGKVN